MGKQAILNEINTTQRMKYRVSIKWNTTYPLGGAMIFRIDVDWNLTNRMHQLYFASPWLYRNNYGHNTCGTTWIML